MKFQFTLDSKYEFDKYNDVIRTYQWLKNGLEYAINGSDVVYSESFSFVSGNMSYECCSLDEFKKYAFGKPISTLTLFIHAQQKNAYLPKTLAHIWGRRNPEQKTQQFELSTDDELLLVQLHDALLMDEQSVASSVQVAQPPQVKAILDEKKLTAECVDSICADAEQKKEQPQSHKKWFSKLFWMIVIPIAVTVIAGLILSWIGI